MEVSTFSAYIKRGLYFVFSLVFIICVGLFYLNTPARASVPSSNLLWTGYPNFVFTNAIATDSNGNIYVAGGGYPDYDSRIAVYNRSTHLQVATIGQNGSGNGQFRSVTDIAIDSSGNIYVVDSSNNRIQKFNSSYVWQWTIGGTAVGSGNSQFNYPSGIGLDNSGHFYVADTYNNRIQIFNSSNGSYISQFGSVGGNDGKFKYPRDVVINSEGNIIVSDSGNHRIQIFNSSRVFITKFGKIGSNIGEFSQPSGLAIDSADNLYVSDYGNDRIQKFSDTLGIYSPIIGSNDILHFPNKIAIYEGGGNYFLDAAAAQWYVSSRFQEFDFSNTDYQISNLASTLDVVVAANNLNIESSGLAGINSDTAALRLRTATGLTLSDVTVDMTADRSWPDITGDSSLVLGKSFVHDLIGSEGVASTHTLYVPVPTSKTSETVFICPNAASMNDVSDSCSGGVEHGIGSYSESFGDIVISKVSNLGDNHTYWKITGMTGSGGLAYDLLEYTGDGSGTQVDPYEITTCDQLQEMKDNRASYYIITDNIDCSVSSTWNTGSGFVPIGTLDSPFTGSLDGNNYEISNLTENWTSESPMGLFGVASGAVFHDVKLTNINFNGYFWVGGLVGHLTDGTVQNCTTSGTIGQSVPDEWGGFFGGLIGSVFGTSHISDSSSSVNIVFGNDAEYMGGLIGQVEGNTLIESSHATGSIHTGTDPYEIGGFIGIIGENEETNVTVRNCYATGEMHTSLGLGVGENVNGGDGYWIAGFVGWVGNNDGYSKASIIDSYATGNIIAEGNDNYWYGGFVGWILGDSQIINSYATGNITALGDDNYWMGGFGGQIGGNTLVKDCHAIGNVDAGYAGNGMGGFAGWVQAGDHGIVSNILISDSYSNGDVTVSYEGYGIGGFVGWMGYGHSSPVQQESMNISNSYSTGNVSVGIAGKEDWWSESIGGFIGFMINNSTSDSLIYNSYSSGTVDTIGDLYNVGGFLGYLEGNLSATNSYWDMDTSGLATSVLGTPLHTAAMKTQGSFIGWDFNNTWGITSGINNGYPAFISNFTDYGCSGTCGSGSSCNIYGDPPEGKMWSCHTNSSGEYKCMYDDSNSGGNACYLNCSTGWQACECDVSGCESACLSEHSLDAYGHYTRTEICAGCGQLFTCGCDITPPPTDTPSPTPSPTNTPTPTSTPVPARYIASDMIGNASGNWSYSHGSNGSLDQFGLTSASSVSIDYNHHRLFVADSQDGWGTSGNHNRVLVYNLNEDNTLIDRGADFVIGQPDMFTANTNTNISSTKSPRNVLYDNKYNRLFVSDSTANRILVFDGNNISTSMNATYVIGQANFNTSSSGVTATKLYQPMGLAFDSATDRLFVADMKNYRVVTFDVRPTGSSNMTLCGVTTTGIATEMSASCVIGQSNLTQNDGIGPTQNFFGDSGASGGPRDVTYDSNNNLLYVADSEENRVLVFDVRAESSSSRTLCGTTTTGLINNGTDAMPASCVIGQSSFTDAGHSNPPTSTSLYTPRGLWFDGASNTLYVADIWGYRILLFDTNTLSNNLAAHSVIGQLDFVTDEYGASDSIINAPTAVTYDNINNRLFMTDAYNYRVMIYDFVHIIEGTIPDGSVGTAYSKQLTTQNSQGTVSFSLNSGTLPGGITLSSGGLLSGTPTENGNFSFTVKAEDNNGAIGNFSSLKSFSLNIPIGSFTVNDTLTRLKVGVNSDYTIVFGTINGLTESGNTIVVNMADWDISALTVSDLSLYKDSTILNIDDTPGADTWGVSFGAGVITLTAPTTGSGYISAGSDITLKIGIVAGGLYQPINPENVGSYRIFVTNNTSSGPENGEASIPIVDSDQVNITGFVNAFMTFDIDVGTDASVQCDPDTCKIHGGFGAGTAENYTVDLGELKSVYVNRSNGDAVDHSDGLNGVVNSIYFDLSTNAAGGALVTVLSANGGLKSDTDAMIPASTTVAVNTKSYGLQVIGTPTAVSTQKPDAVCFGNVYCLLSNINPATVFNTDSHPIDSGRVQVEVAASVDAVTTPGSYTDTLTFVATATF